MGCEGDKTKCACGLSAVLLVISWVCWVIMVSNGWKLYAMVYPENQLVYAAAIISSIPFYAVALHFLCICPFGKSYLESNGVLGCLLVFEMLAGVTEIVGGIMFITATLNDPNVYGVSAGIFGIIAGVTNIIFQLRCCTHYLKGSQKTKNE